MIVTDKVKNIPIIIGNKIINATPAPVEPTAPVAVAVAVTVEAPVVPAADELAACREKGLLVLTAKTRLRLLPPLTVSEHEEDMALEVLAEVLGTMEPTAPKEQA